MKTKAQKRTEAKKKAEAMKAQRKVVRMANAKSDMAAPTKKGKSLVPQSKTRK